MPQLPDIFLVTEINLIPEPYTATGHHRNPTNDKIPAECVKSPTGESREREAG